MKTDLGKTDTGRIRAFTLIELLVVIGIIALLIGILIPVISKVRTQGHVADTKNFISQWSVLIEQYHADQRAYPGPIPNDHIYTTYTSTLTQPTIPVVVAPGVTIAYDQTLVTSQITMAENLVLGLLGGLNLNATTNAIQYDPSQVDSGLGPMNLNPANPKRYPPYITVTSKNLDWTNPATGRTGHYSDDAAAANDTIIPEFVDSFPDGMPILYLRARVGQPLILTTDTAYGPAHNGVITNGQTDPANPTVSRVGQYDISQIIAYTQQQTGGAYIGTGKTLKPSDYVPPFAGQGLPHGLATVTTTATLNKSATGYTFPYDAYPYFQSPNSPASPRQKDGYILISPGPDRVYGTSDDICSFGDPLP